MNENYCLEKTTVFSVLRRILFSSFELKKNQNAHGLCMEKHRNKAALYSIKVEILKSPSKLTFFKSDQSKQCLFAALI